VNAYVDTVDGAFAVDLETEEVEPANTLFPESGQVVSLPRLVASAAAGSTVVAVVNASPPMLVSHDAGVTWRESGRGLPRGRAVAIAEDDPDLVVYASRNRLHLSRDGGRFWTSLAVELPEIRGVTF
jgi:hypothetical protein